jgi:outer membrane protein assembly factor BamB
MRVAPRQILVATAWIGFVVGQGVANEWTRFRGPNGSGVSADSDAPVTWTEKDFRWRVAIPGQGHSQPVAWGARLFLTSALKDGAERLLLCVRDSDGTELWRRAFPLPTPRTKNRNSGYANSSPVVDARRVIACFVSAEHFWVRAFDHEGNALWSRDLGPFDSPHGHGASPIIHGNSVIVVQDQDNESGVVALDLETGGILWQAARRRGEGAAAYGTPVIAVRVEAAAEIILTSRSHGISSLDARTGALLWEARVLRSRTVASPSVAGDLIIGTCGQGVAGPNALAAVRRGGKGDVSETHVAYTLRAGVPCAPTPIYFQERLYLISDAGVATAVEAATGRVIWSERLGAEFFGSPVLVAGRIYAPSVKGEMFVLSSGREFRLLARNALGEGTQSSPCVHAGRIYMKTRSHLLCVGENRIGLNERP